MEFIINFLEKKTLPLISKMTKKNVIEKCYSLLFSSFKTYILTEL